MGPLYRGRRLAACLLPAAAASALVASCETANVPVLTPNATTGDAGVLPVGPTTRIEYCSAAGPTALVDADGGTVCPASVAQTTFRFAVCTCGDLVAGHTITTDAFDGSLGAYDPTRATTGGALATDGNLNASAKLDVGGSIWAAGNAGLTSTAPVVASGELHALGQVNVTQWLTVGTDAWLAGGLIAGGNVLIPGTLHMPSGAPLSVGGTQSIGAQITGPVTVPPPCDCSAASLLDVIGLVEGYRAHNDDTSAGIDARMLENVTTPLSEALPCGRLFFTGVDAHAPVTLTTSGRTALFIGGDFKAESDVVLESPTTGELDVFIEGNVLAAGQLRVGSAANPARAHIYVGGSGTVNLQSAVQIAGNLYAPRAEVVLGGAAPVTVFGSIFAGRLNAGSDLTVHFDESIARQSAACPAPAGACATCRDCGNQACVAGACGSCADSSECCAPAVCRSGTCVLDVR
jgi:hypothetical protein